MRLLCTSVDGRFRRQGAGATLLRGAEAERSPPPESVEVNVLPTGHAPAAVNPREAAAARPAHELPATVAR